MKKKKKTDPNAAPTIQIFERSRFSREVGAAIAICPNATRILTRWGFDFERAGAVANEKVVSFESLSGSVN